MPSLEDYAMFVKIMDAGSISVAAKLGHHSVQNVSRALARVESELGVVLARRTTRSFAPTSAGQKLLQRLRKIISELDRAKEELHEEAGRLAGDTKISSSTLFGPKFVVPAIAAFLAHHPEVTFDLRVSDNFVDPISADVDIAIRIGFLSDSSLVAKLLGYSRRVIFASPAYVAKNGEPTLPTDLTRHSCILRTDTNEGGVWRIKAPGGEEKIAVSGGFMSDSAAACNEAAMMGARNRICSTLAGPGCSDERRFAANSNRLRGSAIPNSRNLASYKSVVGSDAFVC
jgi:DNA-binding transcriptional LysR family regulator